MSVEIDSSVINICGKNLPVFAIFFFVGIVSSYTAATFSIVPEACQYLRCKCGTLNFDWCTQYQLTRGQTVLLFCYTQSENGLA